MTALVGRKKLVLVLVLLVGVGMAGALTFLLDGPDAPPPPKDCGIPAGLVRSHRRVTWNPISEPGRCPETSANLLIDNGTATAIEIALGTEKVVIAPKEYLVIVTLPGPFALRVTRGGATITDDKLALLAGHTYVYNPEVAWTYVRRKLTYGQGIGAQLTFGGPSPDQKMPRTEVFDAEAIDFILDPPPEKITIQGNSEDRFTLQHVGDAQVTKGRVEGLWRVTEVDGRVIITRSGQPDASVSIFIDNVDDSRVLPITLDGVTVSVSAGGWLEIVTSPGKHELVATLATTTERETIETKILDKWVWTPKRARQYMLETLYFGDQPSLKTKPSQARALPPFRTKAEFVFRTPDALPMSGSATVLRRGVTRDFRKQLAQEVRALKGTVDEAAASECDVLLARRIAESGGKAATEAKLWDCP